MTSDNDASQNVARASMQTNAPVSQEEREKIFNTLNHNGIANLATSAIFTSSSATTYFSAPVTGNRDISPEERQRIFKQEKKKLADAAAQSAAESALIKQYRAKVTEFKNKQVKKIVGQKDILSLNRLMMHLTKDHRDFVTQELNNVIALIDGADYSALPDDAKKLQSRTARAMALRFLRAEIIVRSPQERYEAAKQNFLKKNAKAKVSQQDLQAVSQALITLWHSDDENDQMVGLDQVDFILEAIDNANSMELNAEEDRFHAHTAKQTCGDELRKEFYNQTPRQQTPMEKMEQTLTRFTFSPETATLEEVGAIPHALANLLQDKTNNPHDVRFLMGMYLVADLPTEEMKRMREREAGGHIRHYPELDPNKGARIALQKKMAAFKAAPDKAQERDILSIPGDITAMLSKKLVSEQAAQQMLIEYMRVPLQNDAMKQLRDDTIRATAPQNIIEANDTHNAYMTALDPVTATKDAFLQQLEALKKDFTTNSLDASKAFAYLHKVETTMYPNPEIAKAKINWLDENKDFVQAAKFQGMPGYAETFARNLRN